MKSGTIISYNKDKEIGRIKDSATNIEYTFLKADCAIEVAELQEVKFDVVFEKSRNRAINVQSA